MYVRFFRWASDRVRDAGIVAFITNRSFIDARNFDGFRRVVASDFDEVYIIDLGGDWKKKGRGGGGNVFGIGTGVAISFWIRRRHREARSAKIYYALAPDGAGDEKLAWLEDLNTEDRSFKDIAFEQIEPEDGILGRQIQKYHLGPKSPLPQRPLNSISLARASEQYSSYFL